MPQNHELILADGSAYDMGKRVSLALTPSDVQTPSELASYCAGFKNWRYNADEVSPTILTEKKSDYYRTFDSDDAFTPVIVKTSGNAKVGEVDPKSSTALFKTQEMAIGSFITEGLTGDSFDPKMAAVRRCRNVIDLDREIRVMRALVGTNTNWAATVRTALTTNENWNGGSSSTPIEDLQNAIQKSYQPVTGIWMNEYVFHAFMRHANVKSYMRQMLGDGAVQSAPVSGTDVVGSIVIPGLPRINISRAKYNPDGTLTYVMPNSVVLITKPPVVPKDGEECASSYTFRYKGVNGEGYNVREYRDESRGANGGDMIVVTLDEVETMTGSTCGGIITGIIA